MISAFTSSASSGVRVRNSKNFYSDPIYPVALLILCMTISACSTAPEKKHAAPKRSPAELAKIPDAVPKAEPKSELGNMKTYEVFGKRYFVLDSSDGFTQKGIASWYGPDFHGKKTSSGEIYDMYAMTAAHKTLPLPTYLEVKNLENGRKIIVRVNDRGRSTTTGSLIYPIRPPSSWM